jgi:hypothetical protein
MSSNTVPHSLRHWSLLVGSALLVGAILGHLAVTF